MERAELIMNQFLYEIRVRKRRGARLWHVEAGNTFEGWREVTSTASKTSAEKACKELTQLIHSRRNHAN